jgi:hypothetical protein
VNAWLQQPTSINGIKEHTHQYKNCNALQPLIFGRYFKVKNNGIYTQVISLVNANDHSKPY